MSISSFITQQLPDEFVDNSPKFVEFLKEYYNWLENNNVIGNVTNYQSMMRELDVDTVSDANLPKFIQTYLCALPQNTNANIRVLLKHALDLYRSKGTLRSFKLFFKAIFNQDVEMYVPNKDILYISNSQWKQPQYIEITDMPLSRLDTLADYVDNKIVGSFSGATAVVDSFEVKYLNNRQINVLQLSNVVGKFTANEFIDFYNTTSFTNSPKMIGSLSYVV
jgi:hypothetical protein